MKKNLLLLIFAVMTFCGAKAQIMWDAEHLAQVRSELKDNNFYSLVFEHLKADADAMLNAPPHILTTHDLTSSTYIKRIRIWI